MKRANTIRLMKEEQQLLKDPIHMAVVRRKGHSQFHFCLFGLDGDYQGGYYHGVLVLPEDYPFAPPQLKFFTPSGYFEVDTRVCTTFTDYHRQSWSAVWNVESMVMGVISFMLAGEASVGVRIQSKEDKLKLARSSMQFNLKNPLFMEIFGKEKFVAEWSQANMQQPAQLAKVAVVKPLNEVHVVPQQVMIVPTIGMFPQGQLYFGPHQ